MEAVNTHSNRGLMAIGVLVATGWVWSLSNVQIPDILWFANAALTLVLIALLAVLGVRRVRRT